MSTTPRINRPIKPAVVTTESGSEVCVQSEVRTWSSWDHAANKVVAGLEPERIVLTGAVDLDASEAREVARLLLAAANRLEPSIPAMRAQQILTDEYDHESRHDQPEWVAEVDL